MRRLQGNDFCPAGCSCLLWKVNSIDSGRRLLFFFFFPTRIAVSHVEHETSAHVNLAAGGAVFPLPLRPRLLSVVWQQVPSLPSHPHPQPANDGTARTETSYGGVSRHVHRLCCHCSSLSIHGRFAHYCCDSPCRLLLFSTHFPLPPDPIPSDTGTTTTAAARPLSSDPTATCRGSLNSSSGSLST